MVDVIERVPPQSREAEQSVVGSMLVDRDAIAKVIEILQPEDFYIPAHKDIYEGVQDLFASNKPVDIITVGEWLRDRNLLDKIGGISYLADLAGTIPITANVEAYAYIVEEKSVLRQLIQAGQQVVTLAYEEDKPIGEILDQAEKVIFGIGQRRGTQDLIHIRDIIQETFGHWDEQGEDGHQQQIASAFVDLDTILGGGLSRSDLIVLAARPAMGKTALSLNIACKVAAQRQMPVAIFSLEMSKEQLMQRLLCLQGRLSSIRLRSRNMSSEEFKIVNQTAAELSMAPIYIDDSSSLSVIEIRAKARRLKAELGDIGLIIIDYLQLMEASAGRSDNRVQEISQITRNLKGLARELRVPVMALSQLSRKVEERTDKRPMLSDLRESGSIEQDSDVVLFIYRDDYYHPTDQQTSLKPTELIVAKHRNGPTGKVYLMYQSDYTRFENASREGIHY